MNQRNVAALMGRKVIVSAVYHRVKEDTTNGFDAYWHAQAVCHGGERPGWIVGIRYLPSGHFKHGSPATNVWGEYDYHPPEWRASGKSDVALLVCYWPSEKPVLVPLNGYRLCGDSDPEPFPSAWGICAAGYAKDRQRHADVMRGIEAVTPTPRDAKGRFRTLKAEAAK